MVDKELIKKGLELGRYYLRKDNIIKDLYDYPIEAEILDFIYIPIKQSWTNHRKENEFFSRLARYAPSDANAYAQGEHKDIQDPLQDEFYRLYPIWYLNKENTQKKEDDNKTGITPCGIDINDIKKMYNK